MPRTNLSNTVSDIHDCLVVQDTVGNNKLPSTNLSYNTELLPQRTIWPVNKPVTEEEKYKAIQVRNKNVKAQFKLQLKKIKDAKEEKRKKIEFIKEERKRKSSQKRREQIKINEEIERYLSLQKKIKVEKYKLETQKKIQEARKFNIAQEAKQEKVLLNYAEQQSKIAAIKARIMKKNKIYQSTLQYDMLQVLLQEEKERMNTAKKPSTYRARKMKKSEKTAQLLDRINKPVLEMLKTIKETEHDAVTVLGA